jgi:hypothetical protein
MAGESEYGRKLGETIPPLIGMGFDALA